MGDSRAEIKIDFSIYGKDYHQSWWINWWAEEDEVDRRIINWFVECVNDAENERGIREAQQQRERVEAQERAEYERLKAKFAPSPPPTEEAE